jgi:hypothetical protein
MSSPAGWYPQPDGQQRYWDGQQWTENFAPGATAPVMMPEGERVVPVSAQFTPVSQGVPVPVEVKGSNGLAVAGFVLALLGALSSFIPIVNIGGDFLAFLGLVFGVIGLVQSGRRRAGKGLSIAAIILALAAFVISIIVNMATVAVVNKAVEALPSALATSSASATSSDTSTSASSDTSKGDSSFKDGVLTTPEMRIEITDHKIIPVGAKGNEYGKKPVIAFWYKITNLTDKDLTPMEWLWVFTAYQDNNPNAENKLQLGLSPDDRFGDSHMENIKKGGTVEDAIAYELDDETTPVDLVASELFGITDIGKMTYNLK